MNAIRTTHKTYEFSHPFSLIGYAQSFLPGRYSIEIEEEVPSGSGVLDFSRVKSRLYFTPQFGAPVEIGFLVSIPMILIGQHFRMKIGIVGGKTLRAILRRCLGLIGSRLNWPRMRG